MIKCFAMLNEDFIVELKFKAKDEKKKYEYLGDFDKELIKRILII